MKNSNKYIVITTINNPNESIFEFLKWKDWKLVIVGDRKTDPKWECENVTYLSIDKQYEMFGEFAKTIPENTYTRKMLGYVFAINNGATAIFESDDDNISYPFGLQKVDKFLSRSDYSHTERIAGNKGWFNVYDYFGAGNCWPRGFPLERIKDSSLENKKGKSNNPPGLVQFLADEDPDVDAIYRMVNGDVVYFEKEKEIILDEGTFCPINSQATLWTPNYFPFLYLPLGVYDRVTDILRGYIATAGIWASNHSVAFASPIVYQKRNYHNLHKDFLQELPLYTNAEIWCQAFNNIEEKNPIEYYKKALQYLESTGVFTSSINKLAYEQFLRLTNLI